jgi:hypothetical protein
MRLKNYAMHLAYYGKFIDLQDIISNSTASRRGPPETNVKKS